MSLLLAAVRSESRAHDLRHGTDAAWLIVYAALSCRGDLLGEVLGWRPRPIEETILDTAASLAGLGLLRDA